MSTPTRCFSPLLAPIAPCDRINDEAAQVGKIRRDFSPQRSCFGYNGVVPPELTSRCCTPPRVATPPSESRRTPIQGGGRTPAMVELPGGRFRMGDDRGEGYPGDREGPSRSVDVDSFAIAECAVSNREFGEFVEATGYVSDAERFGWSFVFVSFLTEQARSAAVGYADGAPWWVG